MVPAYFAARTVSVLGRLPLLLPHRRAIRGTPGSGAARSGGRTTPTCATHSTRWPAGPPAGAAAAPACTGGWLSDRDGRTLSGPDGAPGGPRHTGPTCSEEIRKAWPSSTCATTSPRGWQPAATTPRSPSWRSGRAPKGRSRWPIGETTSALGPRCDSERIGWDGGRPCASCRSVALVGGRRHRPVG